MVTQWRPLQRVIALYNLMSEAEGVNRAGLATHTFCPSGGGTAANLSWTPMFC